MREIAIELKELAKEYQRGYGIKELSLTIEAGSVFGLLGPNGAGKTTTIRLLMGFMQADSGEAKIYGLDCWQDRTELKKYVSYLPGELRFLENLTGAEFLRLVEGLHENKQEIAINRTKLLKRLELNPEMPIRKMSKGMKQKLGIVTALMTDKPVLLLDEPTSGLDPLMQQVFVELLLEEKQKGKTIFMSSHHFPEVEKTCDQVGILRKGKLLALEKPSNLIAGERQSFEVEVAREEDVAILQQSGLTLQPLDGHTFAIHVEGAPKALWQTLAQVEIKRFQQRRLELEKAFLNYYQEQRGEQF